jgi:hypothetical protein
MGVWECGGRSSSETAGPFTALFVGNRPVVDDGFAIRNNNRMEPCSQGFSRFWLKPLKLEVP